MSLIFIFQLIKPLDMIQIGANSLTLVIKKQIASGFPLPNSSSDIKKN
jgi:hypothetical protein